MKRKSISHVEFAKMATAFAKTKEAIKQELRVKTLTEMARDRGIPMTTFRSLCEAVDIDVRACLFPANGKKPKMSPLLIQDMLAVMARICTELKIDGSEIQKYLK